jgi:endonuclease/exonuclease/phosphatase family metal-dependent hydrolase
MRIVSYNILTGGEGRADPLCEVLLAQRADVIGLVEAHDPAVLERVARRLGMDYVVGEGNQGGASALLSRFPIRESVNVAAAEAGISKSFLRASVGAPGGAIWEFGVVHLHARAGDEDESRREGELAIVLRRFAPLRAAGTPHVILGDFNANSPVQEIDLSKCKPKTREQAAGNPGGQIPRRVVAHLTNEGYADSYQLVRPELARRNGTFTTQFPGQRVDYIFIHGFDRSRVRDAWIEYDRLATYASDHYPIGAEID